jgi:hypothetical protein
LDVEAADTCGRLASTFGLDRVDQVPMPGVVPVGIEIEVPWRSYFPGLVQRYGLDARRFQDLRREESAALTAECSELELLLRPRLEATVVCGVPRGNDRYWEFAFAPACDVSHTLEQVRLLSAAGLLPRDRKHSLHITLGGIARCKSVYFLAMLLESRYVDPQRLVEGADRGLHPSNNWGRKGLAGVLEKGASELVAGAQVACEMRMLQLPVDDSVFRELMATVRQAADAIADHIAGVPSDKARQWREFQAEAEGVLARRGLPLNNWWRGGIDGGVNRDAWRRFSESLELVRHELRAWYREEEPAMPVVRAMRMAG